MGRRAGRKRKNGPRHPGGQTVKAKPDLKTKTSRQPHRRALAVEQRADERGESPLGRLYLRHEQQRERNPGAFDPVRMIDADCFDAGARYAFIVGEYGATIGTPRTTAGSGRGMGTCVVDACARAVKAKVFDPELCACFRRKSRYDDAFETLARVGRPALMAVNRVAVHRAEPASEEEIVYLVAGLRALARHFGLTRAPRRAHYQNAN